jgi:hypothetical protein
MHKQAVPKERVSKCKITPGTNVHEMLRRNSGVSSPHQQKKKCLYQYMSANSFRGAYKQCGDLSPLDF